MRVRRQFCFVFMAGLLAWTPEASAQNGAPEKGDPRYEWKYEVRGRSTENNADHPFTVKYADEDYVKALKETIERDHAPGGLLATDPDKPIGLYVQDYWRPKSSGGSWRPGRPPAEDDVVSLPRPSAPPGLSPIVKLPPVTLIPSEPSKPTYPADDPRGTEGAYNNPLDDKKGLAGTKWASSDTYSDGSKSTTTWVFNADQTGEWTHTGVALGEAYTYRIQFKWKRLESGRVFVENVSGDTNWGKTTFDPKGGVYKLIK